jgi:hypothetical protein
MILISRYEGYERYLRSDSLFRFEKHVAETFRSTQTRKQDSKTKFLLKVALMLLISSKLLEFLHSYQLEMESFHSFNLMELLKLTQEKQSKS